MHFGIDYSSLEIQQVVNTRKELIDIVCENGVELDLMVVSNPEDLVLQFNINQMNTLFKNITGTSSDAHNKDNSSKKLWDALVGERPEIQEKGEDLMPKNNEELSYVQGLETPKEGTLHFTNWEFIDDNLGTATTQELIDNFCEKHNCDQKKARDYIKGGLRRGFIEEDDL